VPSVTSIERQKRSSSRFSVFVDGDYGFSCTAAELVDLNISKGDELSDERLREITQAFQTSRARQKAISYLARRSHSCQEMREYLRRRGFESDLIDDTISWLRGQKYLDDETFAEQWVDSRLRTAPRGRRKLMAELQQKGIDRDLAARVVDENLPSEDEAEVAYQLLQRRKNRLAGEERLDMKRKVVNFLRYRGFSGAALIDAGNRFLEEMFESGRD
jgi:regulatory protein